LTEQVDVAEALIFRVANTISACDSVSETNILDPNDSASDLVTLSPNPMTIAGTSTGTAQFCASTNAQNGYVITYADWGTHSYDAHAGFWNGSHEFNPGGILAFTSTPGTEQFGLRVAVSRPRLRHRDRAVQRRYLQLQRQRLSGSAGVNLGFDLS